MIHYIHPSVPAGLSVALFKGTRPGIEGMYNRIGRWLDAGPYSHSEIVFTNRVSASASLVDCGVRFKNIGYSSVGNWDFLPIPDPTGAIETLAFAWFIEHHYKKYDWLGNIRFATNFARDDPDKWFCSESNMAALGFPEPFRYGPSGAATALVHHFDTRIIRVSA